MVAMELRHLDYFVAVAEEGGFTAAAARLHVVQSAVSAGLKALERELGTVLVERTSRRVGLTDAGAVLLPHARASLDAARDGRDAVAAAAGGLRGTVRVGMLTSVGWLDVPALLARFHHAHPGVALRLSAAPSGSSGLVASVAERRLDLAFVSVPGPRPAGVRLTDLGAVPMDLVLPLDDPLAGRRKITVADLAERDFVDSPLGFGNRGVVDRAFESAGVARRVVIEVADIATAPSYVRHGLGIAILPRFTTERLGADAVVRTVEGADLSWPIGLATPADRTPSAAAARLAEMVVADAAGRS